MPVARAGKVFVLAVALVLGVGTGCSDLLSSDGDPAGTPDTPVTSTAVVNPKACLPDSCPQLPTPAQQFDGSGVTADNADTTVSPYLVSLLDDLDDAWGGWFVELDWGDPSTGRALIEPGTTFRTDCTDGDATIGAVSSDMKNAFFCGVDSQPNGQGAITEGTVILPVETFVGIWRGDVFGASVPSAVVGDFTAATVVAHEYGHNVVFRIARALGIPDSSYPQGNNRELIADCFAGNWAATVFDRDDLSVRNILQAATLLPLIGDPGPDQGHGTIRERAAALTTGLTGKALPTFERRGQPVDCLVKYWPERFSG
ncbi:MULTISPECIES: neutral zinc metallopeptidase [Gordonia]|uniref:metalloprotease n=1 Tax=Gordonia TaxID=2053 RepID=UPI001FE7610D|nr:MULTISPECIES: metalloprotease [Gordonia]